MERKERRGRSTRAAALSTPVDAGEEDFEEGDGEEEREVSAIMSLIFMITCSLTWHFLVFPAVVYLVPYTYRLLL